ncbi:hypothetical protein AP3564_10445 [Aeribacillus pallidus]|uniref:Uncharacterized protein n=1 Tax=Aeribacillus pallidus TaxID=33936 RepID=A0A223E5Q2_9BACI|nr:hypothetical protein AP3564_10445 [Aeribacillus pallidus]
MSKFCKIDMFNNKRFGIVKEKIDTWVAPESIVTITSIFINRRKSKVGQMFLGGIQNRSKSGD